MIFTPTILAPACVVEIEPLEDARGFFARSFCREEFEAAGLPGDFVQCSVSFNHAPFTLRGLHYQAAPAAEGKLVRCTRGAIYDVMLDLRRGGETYLRWLGFELTEENAKAVYIPPGFAHGFMTLREGTEILYQMTARYEPAFARGVRWDDPAFGIDWPHDAPIISVRDAGFADYVV